MKNSQTPRKNPVSALPNRLIMPFRPQVGLPIRVVQFSRRVHVACPGYQSRATG
jgi:hypothetical protein